jgi:hypothetical protein
MNFNRLKQIRQQVYDSLERGADALFNLADALLCESQAQSLPELSLSPFFERRWPSISEALEDGRINDEQLRAIWVKALLEERAESELICIGVDTSNLTRANARTSADRTIIHLPNLPLVDKAISIGWTFSTVVLLPEQASSWTPILDQARVSRPPSAWLAHNCKGCGLSLAAAGFSSWPTAGMARRSSCELAAIWATAC